MWLWLFNIIFILLWFCVSGYNNGHKPRFFRRPTSEKVASASYTYNIITTIIIGKYLKIKILKHLFTHSIILSTIFILWFNLHNIWIGIKVVSYIKPPWLVITNFSIKSNMFVIHQSDCQSVSVHINTYDDWQCKGLIYYLPTYLLMPVT